MQEQIREYIRENIKELKSGESVDLKGVYPKIIEDVIGTLEGLDLNGWEGDYWASNSEYEVSGCMYYGTAEIEKK